MSRSPSPEEERCYVDDAGNFNATAEPATSPPFSYDDRGGFRMNSIKPATRDGLEEFCKARNHAQTKEWLTTQMELFGVSFQKSSSKDVLTQGLKAAHRSGKCDRLAAPVEAIRTKLQQEYDEAVVATKDKYFANLKGGVDEEAYVDAPRVLAKHFLTTGHLGGAPDRTKTKTSLVLKSAYFKQRLLEAVDAIPGLAAYQSSFWSVVGWDTQLERAVQRHFDKLVSLPASDVGGIIGQATFDFDRFVRKYLHIDPAQNYRVTSRVGKRPTAVIAFPARSPCSWDFDHHDRLQELIERTPGLCVKGHKVDLRVTVVGWDAAMVDAEIERLQTEDRLRDEKEAADNKAEKEKQEAQRNANWEQLMKPHRDLAAQKRSRPGPLTSADLVGSYILIWEGKDGEEWGDPRANPYATSYSNFECRLDVFPGQSAHGVRASFYLGLIDGNMLLATSRRSVELLREEQDKGRDRNGDCDSDGEDEEEKDAAKTGEKRQLGSVSDPWGVQAAMAKRQKLDPAPKQEVVENRAYFQFVCKRVVDGYPEVDLDNSNIGHFDFDNTKLSATGQFSLPFYFGRNAPTQPLALYKVSDEPSRDHQPSEWYEYDGRHWGGGW